MFCYWLLSMQSKQAKHLRNDQEGQPERVPTLLGMPAAQVQVLPLASGAACLGRQATGCGRGVPTSDLGHPELLFIPELTKIGNSATACKARCKICKVIIYDEVTDSPEDNPLGMVQHHKPENQTKGNSSSQGQLGPSPKRDPQSTKEEENLKWDLYWKEYREWLGENQTHSHSWPYQPVKKEPTMPAPTTRHFRDI